MVSKTIFTHPITVLTQFWVNTHLSLNICSVTKTTNVKQAYPTNANILFCDFAFTATCSIQRLLHSPTLSQTNKCSDLLGANIQEIQYRMSLVSYWMLPVARCCGLNPPFSINKQTNKQKTCIPGIWSIQAHHQYCTINFNIWNTKLQRTLIKRNGIVFPILHKYTASTCNIKITST